MGLDMYLKAKKTMPRAAAIMLHKAAPDEFAEWNNPWLKTASQEVEAVADAAYWRKANAVHGWFVKKIQDGVDDCGTYPVTAEQLEELRDACKAVLAGEVGEEEEEEHNLVPMSGFFFGPTDDKVWHTEYLEDTVEQLGRVLRDYKGWAFQYHSSW